MIGKPSCECDLFVHPTVIDNVPGLSELRYRAGDFTSFRHALLLARPGETALGTWRPGGQGDLAVQLVEWWAVLSDILTFYNERIVQEAFLRTADLPESVTNLVRLIGYRPRPALAATGTVAALVSGKNPVTIPAGFQIQSKAGPGKEPQVFEVDADTVAALPDHADVDPPLDPKLFVVKDGLSTLLLSGTVTSIESGDQLLLRRRTWADAAADARLVTVNETRKETSPRGAKNTRVVLSKDHQLRDALAKDWVLLRVTQSAALFFTANSPIVDLGTPRRVAPTESALETTPALALRIAGPVSNPSAGASSIAAQATQVSRTGLFSLSGEMGLLAQTYGQYSNNYWTQLDTTISPASMVEIPGQEIHLESIRTPIDAGDALLLSRPGVDPEIALVTSHGRTIWYQNAASQDNPGKEPEGTAEKPIVPIPVMHSVITFKRIFTSAEITDWNAARDVVKVEYGWTEAGTIIGTPGTELEAGTTAAKLPPADADAEPLASRTAVLLADANGIGAPATVKSASRTEVELENIEPPASKLIAPLELLTNLVSVSRGKSVANEILGSGDATVAGQEFVLAKSPLTYFLSGDGYRSTLRVLVTGIEWKEVASFYGQAADAKVFVTKEDADQKTHVLFGDGISGARLPTGASNVVASYRWGGGADLPDPGTLTVILKPRPGLKAIRNPIAPFGGSEPDDPEKVRAYAPRSVFTFGRAVSADDYEVIAASAPGVIRARAEWAFDSKLQRAMIKVYVGDDEGAADSARAAIAGSRDPNRPIHVELATKVDCSLELTLLVLSDRDVDTVVAAATAAIQDPDIGLLGSNVVRIGQTIYESRIHQALFAVDGVAGVRSLLFTRPSTNPVAARLARPGPRHNPGPNGFFNLTALTIHPEQVV